MEKQKRWQLWLIITVIAITFYNIIPTLIYYSKPLKQPINEQAAQEISTQIVERLSQLDKESKDWVGNYCKYLGTNPLKIECSNSYSDLIEVTFKNEQDAATFKSLFPYAGDVIPFAPARMSLAEAHNATNEPTKAYICRYIASQYLKQETDQTSPFHFVSKLTEKNELNPAYYNLVKERLVAIATAANRYDQDIRVLLTAKAKTKSYENAQQAILLNICSEINNYSLLLQSSPSIAQRYFSRFAVPTNDITYGTLKPLINTLKLLQKQNNSKKAAILDEQKTLSEKGEFLSSSQQQILEKLDANNKAIAQSVSILEKQSNLEKIELPLSSDAIYSKLNKSFENKSSSTTLLLNNSHPFIKEIAIDWSNDQLLFNLHDDILKLKQANLGNLEAQNYLLNQINNLIANDLNLLSQLTTEKLTPYEDRVTIPLSRTSNSTSLLVLDLTTIAKKYAEKMQLHLSKYWKPQHADLQPAVYPIRGYADFIKATSADQAFGLFIYAPSIYSSEPIAGFNTSSIYIVARGLQDIAIKYQNQTGSPEAQQFMQDFDKLKQFLSEEGFFLQNSEQLNVNNPYRNDCVFELDSYYSSLLEATREDFYVNSNYRLACLELTNLEHRLITLNKIETKMHEDLLKARDSYNAAQVAIDSTVKYSAAPPIRNAYWDNFLLSCRKYFRGDERKALKWGLDLSGGKIVHLALRDQSNHLVTDATDLHRAKNELNARLNKMGVSEVNIRTEGTNIVLEFPGSQNISATELIKSSSMSFHVVNEKFGPYNSTLASAANQFLQEVWNEAVMTHRKDTVGLNEIAFRRLNEAQTTDNKAIGLFQSNAAKALCEAGLKIASSQEAPISNAFNDNLSAIARFKGDDPSQWHGQSHPLLITFRNYALEGANLTDIRALYDPNEGNFLSFKVKNSYDSINKAKGNPQEDLYTWTSTFAQDKLTGTINENYTRGQGWRMAVILNGYVISSPVLKASLKDHASITGNFSQREVTLLAADLKAGSLSFTPEILSEVNVSPELGLDERTKGIMASIVGLILVIATMCSYYRFAGIVASVAVFFNLLIMWGVLQNIDAAVTLPGIAAVILTLGMAVDANVLVFERFREEFNTTKRLASAMQSAYKKAFSAIIDSNLTTIIAALILMQFDSGPIKGFAVTLIIGIVSSMFTALFMTRYFFAGWVQDRSHTELKMSQWINSQKFNFLSKAKSVIIASVILAIAGNLIFVSQGKTILGMDFTGGFALTVQIQEKPNQTSYRTDIIEALHSKGIAYEDFQVRRLNKDNHLRIELSQALERKGQPFYNMPLESQQTQAIYLYESNPRIQWVVKALEEANLNIEASQLPILEKSWSEVSGQLSDVMRNNAILSLMLSLVAILIYITVRFEFKYAISAIIGLLHDIGITTAILATLYLFGLPIRIDMHVVAALMTIIGYSLNDTIIVFDRIREDSQQMYRASFQEIINHALNVTLSRTLLTAGTTLLVLFALVFFGGSAIFTFSLTMLIGVLVGTISSLFVAAPILLYFHQLEENEKIGHAVARK
ncbi:MAG: secDF [Chlamydiales bacterium]|jgi:SecD/SecF fusion protein|nr:secDF [Chlamydiales bacterium]